MESLFDKLGGHEAVDTAVDVFYRKVLSDPGIGHFFDSIDMDEQIAKQKAFLTMAFGGPNNYTGKDLRDAHKAMDLKEAHFQAVATHLEDTLKELNVKEELISEVMAIAGGAREDVLNL